VFLQNKSKAEKAFEQYKLEVIKLKDIATDPDVPKEQRMAAQEKLEELRKHHTNKINGRMDELFQKGG